MYQDCRPGHQHCPTACFATHPQAGSSSCTACWVQQQQQHAAWLSGRCHLLCTLQPGRCSITDRHRLFCWQFASSWCACARARACTRACNRGRRHAYPGTVPYCCCRVHDIVLNFSTAVLVHVRTKFILVSSARGHLSQICDDVGIK